MPIRTSQPTPSRRRRRKPKKHFPVLITVLLSGLTLFTLAYVYLQSRPATSTPSHTSTPSTAMTSSTSQEAASHSQAPETDLVWEKQENPVRIPILMYHAIHVMAPEEAANANLIVDPARFEEHLLALQEAGYYTLSPEEAYRVLTENVLPAGKKVVWLTFDDSLWDFHDMAYPLLKQYQMKATNNVITGFTESGRAGHLTVEQMREMQQNGMSFEGHTVNHPDLEYSSLENQEMELNQSKTYLDSQLQQETIAFAYPAGRYSSDTIRIAEATGYKMGLTTNEGLASRADGLLTLNRVRILPHMTGDLLLQTITP